MSLLKNSVWNLLGFLIPSILAIPGMAILARKLTVGEYGLFMLIFALIGYISIFDFGLNRAIIRFVAINKNNLEEKEKILGTSIFVLTIIGFLLVIIMLVLLKPIVNILNIGDIDVSLVYIALIAAFISIPFFLVTQCFTGYLEGLQKFKILNIQKTITNSILVLAPVVFVYIKPSIDYVVIGLALGRFLNLIIAYLFYFKFDKINIKIDLNIIRGLIFYGGWITVSNIISPIMTYFDRFVLSYFTNINTVGFYSVGTEIVTRMSIVPGSISKALFPQMASMSTKKAQYYRYIVFMLVITSILSLPFFLYADEIITIWVGEKYLGETVTVLKILLIGLIFNAMAQVPFTYIQALGFSKTTALIHIYELIPYIILMTYMIFNYGIYGAAVAWVFRMIIDFLLMNYFAVRKM